MTPLFAQLKSFTEEAYTALKIDMTDNGRNNYGPYEPGEPSGHVMHYTASMDSPSRLTNIMRRFRIGSYIMKKGRKQAGVGIAFCIFDKYHEQLETVRAGYPELFGPDGLFHGDVLHWGLDLAFYSSNWANKFTVGTELRNAGKLRKEGSKFFSGKSAYKGRPPVQVRGMWTEPFTDGQILDSVFICRQLKKWQKKHAHFDPMHFMSHHMIHENKWDAWPHYPFGRVKHAVCNDVAFKLDGYIKELNDVRCPQIVDDSTAEDFLRVMGYLVLPAGASNTKMKGYLEEDVTQAIKFFQAKKGLKKTGKLNEKTIKTMNAVRRAYKLHL
jgi:hypothetical protein